MKVHPRITRIFEAAVTIAVGIMFGVAITHWVIPQGPTGYVAAQMLDPETAKIIGSLGLGGVLAWGMFLVYRKDSLAWQEAWKGQQQLLVQVVKENTAAITALITKIENGGHQRLDETPHTR